MNLALKNSSILVSAMQRSGTGYECMGNKQHRRIAYTQISSLILECNIFYNTHNTVRRFLTKPEMMMVCVCGDGWGNITAVTNRTGKHTVNSHSYFKHDFYLNYAIIAKVMNHQSCHFRIVLI